MQTSWLSPALIAAACALGCSTKTPPKPALSPDAVKASERAREVWRAVPANSVGVTTVASPYSIRDLVSKFAIPMSSSLARKYTDAVQAHLGTHFGIALMDAHSLALSVQMGPEGPMPLAIVFPVTGTLPGGETEGEASILAVEDQTFAIQGSHLLMGDTQSVRAGLNALKGENILASKDMAALVASQAEGAYVSGVVNLEALELPLPPELAKIRYGGFRITPNHISATITGETATLSMLRDQIEGGLDLAVAMTKSEADALADMPGEGLAALMVYYNAQAARALVKPRVTGSELRVDVELELGGSGSLLLVSGVGSMAAVAIPAFMKYLKKSKAAEAELYVRRISDAVRAYHAEHGALPQPVALTPARGTCCGDSGEGERCVVDPSYWEHPTWQALGFSMTEPHYYSYELRIQNSPEGSSYSAVAVGDLDCDGDTSEFTLYGQVMEGELMTAPDIIKISPLE